MHAVKRLVLLYIIVLSASSSKAVVSIDHSFSHLEFHKFWHSMTSSHVIVGAKLKISPILRLSLAHFRILSLADNLEIGQPILRLAGQSYNFTFFQHI